MTDKYRRVLVFFVKEREAAGLSHLDLMKTFDGALRASGLPVRMTEGENRRVKTSFPTALPQGMESRLEALEFQVLREPTLREVCERLDGRLPDGLSVVDADALYPGEKWRVASVRYEVRGPGLPGADDLTELLARERIPVERRGKEVDLRPLLRGAARVDDRLVLDIAWTDSGTARPEDVLRVLERDPESFRAVKTGMTFVSSLGETIVRENDEKHPHQ